ncbi:MAG: menaquinone-9 beta-reductase [Nocardioidaceae bacterium]|jgi:geranylgeranyl reductase family protein|nr:menaquinone-9 beta-reductase [Nocardioidaceae bacterium]
MTRTTADERQADVIVVGAGPAGSSTAFHLAQAGADVLLLEKAAFPRDKVCGDGLTPRAVKHLVGMGFDLDEPGWQKNHGLRIVGAGHRLELPWPELTDFPSYGAVRTRLDLDELLARHAEKSGARLQERTSVTGPLVDERTGRVVGVTAKPVDDRGRRVGDDLTYRAPVVVACDGVSARLALALGLERRENRPMAVGIRAYYRTPRHDDPWMESWLELWDGEPGAGDLLPGYGWIFGVGDGTANVGLGVLNTSSAFQQVDYKQILASWLANTPAEWGFTEANRVGTIGSAALPMGFNRKPHYTRGVLLVGDAGGMVNPFNGEGIDYALEAGELAAHTVLQALARPEGAARERVLEGYAAALDAVYGGYFTLGRGFARLIGNPTFMKQATRHGLPRQALMRFLLKLMANLTDTRHGDASDRIINALSRLAPTA